MWLKISSTKLINSNLIPELTIGSKDGKFYILANSVFNNKFNPLSDDFVFDTQEEAKENLDSILNQLNGDSVPQIIIPEGMLQYV